MGSTIWAMIHVQASLINEIKHFASSNDCVLLYIYIYISRRNVVIDGVASLEIWPILSP